VGARVVDSRGMRQDGHKPVQRGERVAETYKVVRFYANKKKHTVKTGLTLEQAQKHCLDPQTSSTTCTSAEGKRRTKVEDPWFDGYTKEQ
jgi:hypothetical protein